MKHEQVILQVVYGIQENIIQQKHQLVWQIDYQ
jgi:hypothetical protein